MNNLAACYRTVLYSCIVALLCFYAFRSGSISTGKVVSLDERLFAGEKFLKWVDQVRRTNFSI